MIVCPRCQATFADPELNYCGRCGADMRLGSERSLGAAAARTVDGEGGDRTAAAGAAAELSSLSSLTPASSELEAREGEEASDDPMLGRVVDGRYRVLDRIGTGGMGAVYKVEHVAMGKVAALKMLHPTLSTEREVIKRFRREAEAVSLLTHPNTVQVFDFGESQGCLYMVMEYLRGDDLAAMVRRLGPLPWSKAAPLLAQVCDALSEAHEKGIVHRDLKPENVLVARTRDGRELCKVLDFGLAKLRQREEMGGVTSRGSVIGTPYYMSPEQIRAEEPDARSDIYSFGATMYRVLTGEYPFTGKTPLAVLSAHLTERVVPPSERRPDLNADHGIDARVDHIVLRCMAKDREARYATIDEVRAAIEASRGPDVTPLPVLAPGERVDETPRPLTTGGVAVVARREDFDRFERELRLRRYLALSLVPLFLLGAALVGWLVWKRVGMARPVDFEVEPNNEGREANLIASGRPVRGNIGKRLSINQSDRDFYHFKVEHGPLRLRLAVDAIPNMDLRVGLFDGRGDALAVADAGGVGAAEVLPNQRLENGDYYIEVCESQVQGRQATENITDTYTLTATLSSPAEDEELEPDDTSEQAVPLPSGKAVRGWLSHASDVDVFRLDGAEAATVAVSGIAGVDVKVVVLPAGSVVRGDPSRLPGAKVFDAGGAGAGEKVVKVTAAPVVGVPPGAPLVAVVRKDPPAAAAATGHEPRESLQGVDTAYTITVTREK